MKAPRRQKADGVLNENRQETSRSGGKRWFCRALTDPDESADARQQRPHDEGGGFGDRVNVIDALCRHEDAVFRLPWKVANQRYRELTRQGIVMDGIHGGIAAKLLGHNGIALE